MYQQASLDDETTIREFLDPNKFAEDGTTSLQQCEFSDNGHYLAYIMCEKGSDWGKIRIKSVQTGQELDETLENVKFSCLSWTHDSKGFFYNQYPHSAKSDGTVVEKNEYQQLFYHRIGTKQSEDILCLKFDDEPNWMGHAEVSDCGNYVVLDISKSCDPVNKLWVCDLRSIGHEITGELPFIKLIDNFDAKYSYVTNEGSVFTFKTNLKALKEKLVTVDLAKYESEGWKDLVAEKDDVLQGVYCINKNKLLLNYMHDCKDQLFLYDLNSGNQLKQFDIEIGTILQITGRKKDDFFFYKFGSFTSPGDIYKYKLDGSDQEPQLYRRSEFKGLNLSAFKTEQVFYESKDGTKIPMFLVSKKTVDKNENNPVFLYGYGGFNISLTPTFSVVRLIWLNHFNGIYACANLRGGGEYGQAWYDAGRLANKQNVFDDFTSAAEYLIQNKYTSKNK